MGGSFGQAEPAEGEADVTYYGDQIAPRSELVEPEQLTDTEARTLAEQEEVVRRGFTTFVEVGLALTVIRDGRLYREEFSSFEKYMAKRWRMSRPRAYELMAAANVVVELVKSTAGEATERVTPNARQARELGRLPEGERATAWQAVVEAAGEGKVTAADVRAEVDRRLGVEHARPAPVPPGVREPIPSSGPEPVRCPTCGSDGAARRTPSGGLCVDKWHSGLAAAGHCPVCGTQLNGGFRAPELQCDGTPEGCKMPDLATDRPEHFVEEQPAWLEFEQEYRGACGCGDVFGGPDEDSVELLLAGHIAQERQRQAADAPYAPPAETGWLVDNGDTSGVVTSATPGGVTVEAPADRVNVVPTHEEALFRERFQLRLEQAQEAMRDGCEGYGDAARFARLASPTQLDELNEFVRQLTGFVNDVQLIAGRGGAAL